MAKTVITVRIDPELLGRVRLLASERRWTVSQFIARATERVVQGELAKRGTVDSDGTPTPP